MRNRINSEYVPRMKVLICTNELSSLKHSGTKLYASVLNNDNTVMHQVCQYKCFVSYYILWAYPGSCQNNEMEIDSNLPIERVLLL